MATVQEIKSRAAINGDITEEELRFLLVTAEQKYKEEVAAYNALEGVTRIDLDGTLFYETPEKIIHRLNNLQAMFTVVRKKVKDRQRYLTEEQSNQIYKLIGSLNL